MVQWRDIVTAFEQMVAMGAKPTKLKIPQKIFENFMRTSINNATELNRYVKHGYTKVLGGAEVFYEGSVTDGRFMLIGVMPDGKEVEISGMM